MSSKEAAVALCEAVVSQHIGTPIKAQLVGSTYINGSGTDIDVLVLVETHQKGVSANEWLIGKEFGWAYGGSEAMGNDQWASWKCGDTNLLVTSDPAYYSAWLTAAETCRALVLLGVPMTKQLRIAVHEVVMGGTSAESVADYVKHWSSP